MKQLDNIYDFEEARLQQVEDYALKNEVLGMADVVAGVKVFYPTTIYNISGDSTSGVAGLLYASGEFLPATPPRKTQRYWEFDETLKYEETPDGVRGNSWTAGEVAWDGSVVGSINHQALDGDDTDEERNIVSRREWDVSLGGEWESTGELWKAMERGTRMKGGRTPGKIHLPDDRSGNKVFGYAA